VVRFFLSYLSISITAAVTVVNGDNLKFYLIRHKILFYRIRMCNAEKSVVETMLEFFLFFFCAVQDVEFPVGKKTVFKLTNC